MMVIVMEMEMVIVMVMEVVMVRLRRIAYITITSYITIIINLWYDTQMFCTVHTMTAVVAAYNRSN